MGFRFKLPAVQDALKAAFAVTLPKGVGNSVGYPRGGLLPRHVWIAASSPAEVPMMISGGRQREESGSVEVRVVATITAADYAPARDKALQLVDAIEDAVAADRTLGGLVRNCYVKSIEPDEAIPDQSTRQAGFKVMVAYEATATNPPSA